MKLKGISKLILAGTALAATAATLTTATYAWYVVNDHVEATGMTGKTSGSAVAGSLLISNVDSAHANIPEGYTTEITLTQSNVSLDPMTKATDTAYSLTKDKAIAQGKTYYTKTNQNYTPVESPVVGSIATYYELDRTEGDWVNKYGKTISGTLLTYSFWLKASSDMTDVKVKTTFTNTTEEPKSQTFYKGVGLPSRKVNGDTYAVDAIYALRMEVVQQAHTVTYAKDIEVEDTAIAEDAFEAAVATGNVAKRAGTSGNYTYTRLAVDAEDTWAADTYFTIKTGTGTENGVAELSNTYNNTKVASALAHHTAQQDDYVIADGFDAATGTGDANRYYAAVMGEGKAAYGTAGFNGAELETGQTEGDSPTLSDTAWSTLSLSKDVDYLITLNIWLEGTDSDCWDSCIGQTFSIALEFDAS